MLSLKLKFNDEYRRVSIHTNEVLTFGNLLETAKILFPSLRVAEGIKFTWADEEGDNIYATSDREVAEALRLMNTSLVKFTIIVSPSAQNVSKSTAVHDSVTCDGCGQYPLVGIRYKCSVREDFDLCETCETASVQPYPMIKIYNKEQAPAAIFVAVNEPGVPRHHFRRGGYHCARGQPPVSGAGTTCDGERKPWECRRNAEQRGPRCGRNAARDFMGYWRKATCEGGPSDEMKATVSPFIAAADAFTAAMAQSVEADVKASDDQTLDEQLLNEAMRQSLQDAELAVAESLAVPLQAQQPVPVSVEDKPTHNKMLKMYNKYASFAPSAPKPMARFVSDVTLPDGSIVAPGSTVIKAWKIRNDGTTQWPEGVYLTFSSGDLLAASPDELMCPVQALNPGKDAQVSVTLTIPDTTGRHVSYFRLRTKEGNIFGQRLWADLRVVADEVTIPDVFADNLNTASNIEDNKIPDVFADKTATISHQISTPAPAVVDEWVQVADSSQSPTPSAPPAPVEIAPTSAIPLVTAPTVVATPSPTDVWSKVWAKELSVLSDMGFTDSAMLIPLLQEHVGLPVSLCPELNGVPPAEGMQKLVMVLLGRSLA